MELIKSNTQAAKQGICIVRVESNAWFDGRTLHAKKKFTVMRRKSTTHDLIKEESDMVGAEDALKAITDTLDIADGLYELKPTYYTDYETGMVDDVDYKLEKIEHED